MPKKRKKIVQIFSFFLGAAIHQPHVFKDLARSLKIAILDPLRSKSGRRKKAVE